MIPWPFERQMLWQSEDGNAEAGFFQTQGLLCFYTALGSRPVSRQDLSGLIAQNFLKNPERHAASRPPWVMLSACPGFKPDQAAEQNGLVFLAGALRKRQQEHQQAGGLLVSIVHQVAVGGTYLMHGLSAPHKAATPGTRFHGTVLDRPPVALEQAQQRGLIDAIVPETELANWLSRVLAQFGHAARPGKRL